MEHLIHESQITLLEKKLNAIQKKCLKYDCDFSFQILQEEFHEVKGNPERFLLVKVEGIAKLNDWVFVATLDYDTESNKNIIRLCGNIEVDLPKKFLNEKPSCDHCHTNRYRKNTYIIMNEKTGEFKQVGRACLKSYTNGLDADLVARFIEANQFVEKLGLDFSSGYSIPKRWIETKTFLKIAFEAINCFGYAKTDSATPTKEVVYLCYEMLEGGHKLSKEQKEEANEYLSKMNVKRETLDEKVNNCLKWLAEQNDDSTYINNLKILANREYSEIRDLGFLASLPQSYIRAIEKKEKELKEKTESNFVGNIGEKITLKIASFRHLTTYYSEFGPTCLYKFEDESGNIYIWKTGKWLTEEDVIRKELKGTIKDLSTFGSVKQTVLTRCKIC